MKKAGQLMVSDPGMEPEKKFKSSKVVVLCTKF